MTTLRNELFGHERLALDDRRDVVVSGAGLFLTLTGWRFFNDVSVPLILAQRYAQIKSSLIIIRIVLLSCFFFC